MNYMTKAERPMPPPDTAALTIDEMCAAFRVSRNRIFDEMKAGRLLAKRVGGRVLIPRENANQWFAALPNRGAA